MIYLTAEHGNYHREIRSPYYEWTYEERTVSEDPNGICTPSKNHEYATFSDRKIFFVSTDTDLEFDNITVNANDGAAWVYTQEVTTHPATATKPEYYTYRIVCEHDDAKNYSNSSYSPIKFGFYMTNLTYHADLDYFTAYAHAYGTIVSGTGSVSSRDLFTNSPAVRLDDVRVFIPTRKYEVREDADHHNSNDYDHLFGDPLTEPVLDDDVL